MIKMETYLIPGRGKTFIYRLYDLDGLPLTGRNATIHLVRVVAGNIYKQWDGSAWADYDPSTESPIKIAMTESDEPGVYMYDIPGSAIGVYYEDDVIAFFEANAYEGCNYFNSEVYKVVEKVIEVTSEEIEEGFVFIDQDGWYTEQGARVPWDDDMEGYLYNDDTGARLVGASVALHEKVVGDVVRSSTPVYKVYSNWQGNWEMWVKPGIYRFYFYKEFFIDKYVDRTVG